MSGDALVLKAAPWQAVAMTLLPPAVLGSFAATLWLAGPAAWAKPVAAALVAAALALALHGRRHARRLHIRLDGHGISIEAGKECQEACWALVATATVERRFATDVDPSNFIVLRDGAGRELLHLSTQLCSRDDSRRILDFIGVRLAERNAATLSPEIRDER